MREFSNKSILIIDDDINLCGSLKLGLIESGAVVNIATDGRAGIMKFEEENPDLVLLDIRMPELDGWETAKYIRMISNTPIIMLTSLKEDEDIIRGMDIGVDDYVTKPFNTEVLWAKVDNVLKRSGETATGAQAVKSVQSSYSDGYLSVNLASRQVEVGGNPVRLTTTEFNLLSYMFKNANRIITYHELLQNVWGKGYKNEAEYTRVYISFLRRNIEREPSKPNYLLNEHGKGYRFVLQVV